MKEACKIIIDDRQPPTVC